MITWLRSSQTPPPINYPCMMMLEDGSFQYGMCLPGMKIKAWSVVNPPEWVSFNNQGKRRGESHPKARLTDEDCELIRSAYASGMFTYQQLADKFDCSKSTIRDIIKFRTRPDVVRMIIR